MYYVLHALLFQYFYHFQCSIGQNITDNTLLILDHVYNVLLHYPKDLEFPCGATVFN